MSELIDQLRECVEILRYENPKGSFFVTAMKDRFSTLQSCTTRELIKALDKHRQALGINAVTIGGDEWEFGSSPPVKRRPIGRR